MEYLVSKNISVEKKYDLFEIAGPSTPFDSGELIEARLFGFNPTKVRIQDRWFDVISPIAISRMQNDDGYYHFIYIQINVVTLEYYIGKVNRKRYSEIKNYKGSGLKFVNKYAHHSDEFIQYYIASCSSSKECEDLEAEIVNKSLLEDPFCLNLVCGGGGTTHHVPTERNEKIRQYQKEHPEAYQAMMEAAKRLYHSGDSPALRARSTKTKKTMSTPKYQEMMSKRILQWKQEHPEEYAQARENNRKAIRRPEVQKKRLESQQKYREEHPEEYEAARKKALEACQSTEAITKRKKSLRAWYDNNPEAARAAVEKRSAASVEVCRTPVNMLDLETGEVLRTFESQRAAADWLKEQGITNSKNPQAQISSVCRKEVFKSGKNHRKKAFGFGWEFAERDEN